MKTTLIFLGTTIFSIAMASGFMKLWKQEKVEREQQFENFTTLIQGVKLSIDSAMIETGVIKLSVKDINEVLPSLKSELKDHGIALKNIVQYQSAILGINAEFRAITSKINDTTYLSSFTDRWLKYQEKRNTGDTSSFVQLNMDVEVKQVIELVKKRKDHFFRPFSGEFLRYDRGFRQKLWTENPYVTPKFSEIIMVSK